MTKKFEIKLNQFLRGDNVCKDFDVQWDEPTCGIINCELSPNGDTIKVEIPEFCEDKCFYATVRCNDTGCLDCDGEQRIKVCPCTGPEECNDCEDCIDGVCISTCEEGMFCDDNGICSECDDLNPCIQNQICVSGKCECPPDKPYTNINGKCVECDEEHPCPTGFICTPDGCIPKDCGDFLVDPITGECVECTNSGDCPPHASCTDDNKCECDEGYVWDTVLEECVEVPECIFDTDCEDCEFCDNGSCVEVECKEGQICDPVDGCIDEPCDGKPCETGLDCGEGCGCDEETGFCVECEDNPDALGCNESPCSGPCDNANPCPPGCGCYFGECVPCGNFPCNPDLCSEIPGCGCDEGECIGEEFECETEFALEKIEESCDLRATLTLDELCPCPRISLFGLRNTNIGISNKDGSPIGVGDEENGNFDEYGFNYLIEVRKGATDSFQDRLTIPLVDDTSNDLIADNDLPLTGSVRVDVEVRYDNYTSGNNLSTQCPDLSIGWTKTSTSNYGIYFSDSVSFNSDVASKVLGVHIPIINGIECIGNTAQVVKDIRITVTHTDPFTFENECEYTPENILLRKVFTSIDAIGGVNGYAELKSEGNRLPLFIWEVSEDGTGFAAIRKLYIAADSPNTYIDTLYGPSEIPLGKQELDSPEGELWSNYRYRVTNDCACEDDLSRDERALFCNTDLDGEVDPTFCNRRVVITQAFLPCDVNQDLARFTGDIPSNAQSQYTLTVVLDDGTTYQEVFQDDSDKIVGLYSLLNGDSIIGWEKTFDSSVVEINISHNHDEDGCFTQVLFTPPTPIGVIINEVVSTINGCEFSIAEDQGSGNIINNITLGDSGVLTGPILGVYTLTLQLEESTTIDVEFTNGCIGKGTASCEDPCSVSLIGLITNGNTEFTVNVDSSVVGVLIDGVPQTILANNTVVFPNPTVGQTYTIEVTNNVGCEETTTHMFTRSSPVDCTDATLNVDVTQFCIGDIYNITFSSSTPNITALTFTVGSTNYLLNSLPDTFTVPNVGGDSLVTISNIQTQHTSPNTGNTCVTDHSDINITFVNNVSVDWAPITDVCLGDTIAFNVTGDTGLSYSIIGSKSGNTNQIENGIIGSFEPSFTSLPQSGNWNFELVVSGVTCIENNTTPVSISVSPTIVIDTIVTDCGGSETEYEVEFNVSPASVVVGDITVSDGTNVYLVLEITSGTLFNRYRATGIPSGASLTITVTHGGCTTSTPVNTLDCTCLEITSVDLNNLEFCEGAAIPTSTATSSSGGNIVWVTSGGDPTDPVDIVASGASPLGFAPALVDFGANSFLLFEAYSTSLASGCFSDSIDVVWYKNVGPDVNFSQSYEVCPSGTNSTVELVPNVSGGQAPYSYLWSGPSIVGSTTDPTAVVDAVGTYNVVVTDSDGCASNASVMVDNCCGDYVVQLALDGSSTETVTIPHGGAGSVDMAVNATGLYTIRGRVLSASTVNEDFDFTWSDDGGGAQVDNNVLYNSFVSYLTSSIFIGDQATLVLINDDGCTVTININIV